MRKEFSCVPTCIVWGGEGPLTVVLTEDREMLTARVQDSNTAADPETVRFDFGSSVPPFYFLM